jgi:renalase
LLLAQAQGLRQRPAMSIAANRSGVVVTDEKPKLATSQTVAIIGSGIAGLACAARLAAEGHVVTLFDKGRRPGGRVATRRAGGAMFDHGAQFATARSESFRALLDQLQARGLMAPWPAAARGSDQAWAGIPGMSALPGAMAEALAGMGVAMHTERHVAWLHPDNSIRHLPAAEAKPGSTSEAGGERSAAFDAVLLALPAPQAAPLLGTRGHDFAARLRDVVIAPCWAVMASFAHRIESPDVIRPNSSPLAWVARNSGRPGQPASPDNWVLHAGAAWSRAHLEDDADSACAALLAGFEAETGIAALPATLVAHRWRYALVEKPLGEPCLWDAQSRLGVCGDWCIGPRVEAAFLSGEALAQSVMANS